MKNEYEIHSVLVVSTAHITSEDNDMLELDTVEEDSASELIVDAFKYGYNISLNTDENEPKPEEGEDGIVWTYSDGLKEVVRLARKLGCKYIKLDRDGSEYEGLEIFEW